MVEHQEPLNKALGDAGSIPTVPLCSYVHDIVNMGLFVNIGP
jgi:hypothetical protein